MKKIWGVLALALGITAIICGCGSTSGNASSGGQNTAESSETAADAGIVVVDAEDDTESPAADTDDEESAACQQAREIYDGLMAYKEEYQYENFVSLQENYNYDENNARYYVNPTSAANLPEEFNETALSLADGEIGMTAKTDYGYFVIMRMAFDEDDLTNIKNDMTNLRFNEELDGLMETAVIEEADLLSEIDFTAYMEKLDELQTLITDTYADLSEAYSDALELEEALLAKLPQEAKEDCVSYLTDGQVSKDTCLMTVDGTQVSAGAFFYMLNYYKLNDYGTGSISESYLTIAMNQAKADLADYALAQNLALDQGIGLSEEEEASNREVMDNNLESSLIYMGCNSDGLEEILTCTSLGNAYVSAMYGEDGAKEIPIEEVYAYAEEEGYYTCMYIWLYEDNSN